MKVCFYCAHYPSENLAQLPLGLAYLGAHLEREGLTSRKDICYARSHDEALAFEPDVLCVSSTSQVIDDAYALCRKAGEALPSARFILGGYHVTALPRLIRPPFEVGVLGEGEITLAELIRSLAESGRWDEEALRGIRGICFLRRDGQVETTARRRLIEDLDSLALPHRDFHEGAEDAYMFTSRGCPYRCIYCASSVHWGKCRYHSPGRVVREMEELYRAHGARRIYLLDDLFAADKERLREIARLLKRKGLLGRLSFHGFVRADLMDDEMAALLARLGFHFVRFGAESASQRLLDKLKKGTVLAAQLQATVDLCNRYGLRVGASFVFGTPGETERDLARTFDFLARNRGKCGLASFYLLTPYPGTEIWECARQRGLVSEDMDWSRLALDFGKAEFDWDKAVYLNRDTIPLARFREVVERFRDAFVLNRGRGGLYSRDRRELPEGRGAEVPEGLRVEVGCGASPTEGYVHCDVRALPHVEHRCNAWELPFAPGSVAEIRSRHMLEHLAQEDVRRTLHRWNVVLAPGGRLDICVPDLEYHVRQLHDPGLSPYADASSYAHGMAGLYGWQCHAEDVHRWGFLHDELRELLEEHGFGDIERVPDRRDMECNIQITALKKRSLGPGVGLARRTGRGWRVRWNDAVAGIARLFAVPEPPGARRGTGALPFKVAAQGGILYRTVRLPWRAARRLVRALSRRSGVAPGAGGPLERLMVKSVAEAEPGHLARYELALRWIRPGSAVLDAACGCGYGSAVLARKADLVVGIDNAEAAIQWAERHFASEKTRFLRHDLLKRGWTAKCNVDCFDAAVSLETVEHLREPRPYLRLIHDKLRSRGIVVVSTPNPAAKPLCVNSVCTNPYHHKHWSIRELSSLFDEVGFEMESWYGQRETVFEQEEDDRGVGYLLAVFRKV